MFAKQSALDMSFSWPRGRRLCQADGYLGAATTNFILTGTVTIDGATPNNQWGICIGPLPS